MVWHTEINQIEFEISSHCNARCPQCPREIFRDRENWSPKSLDLGFFQNRLGKEIFQHINIAMFCGTYGDPSMAKDALEICQFIRDANPKLYISFHTNGGIRKESWWAELARIIGRNGKVVWGFDGLRDTNHLYRIGVDWGRAWENAMSYIAAGGIAEWQYIIFKHNQHQVDTARQLAYDSGFSNFVERQSSRFIYDLYTTGDMRTYVQSEDRYIEPTDDARYRHPQLNNPIINKIEKNDLSKIFDIFDLVSDIRCESKLSKKLYVTVDGYLLPCEHLVPNVFYQKELFPTSENFPEFDKKYPLAMIDLNQVTFKQALSSEWFKGIEKSWKERTCSGRLNTCVKMCGIKDL
jgi:MoaA/NifB/PqqE/SkfB family radical SAM enzyme